MKARREPSLPVGPARTVAVRAPRLPRKTRATLDYLLLSSLFLVGAIFVFLPGIADVALRLWWVTLSLIVAAVLQLVSTALWMTRVKRVARLATGLGNAAMAAHLIVAMVGCAVMEAMSDAIDGNTSWLRLLTVGALCVAPTLHASFYSWALEMFQEPGAWALRSSPT